MYACAYVSMYVCVHTCLKGSGKPLKTRVQNRLHQRQESRAELDQGRRLGFLLGSGLGRRRGFPADAEAPGSSWQMAALALSQSPSSMNRKRVLSRKAQSPLLLLLLLVVGSWGRGRGGERQGEKAITKGAAEYGSFMSIMSHDLTHGTTSHCCNPTCS